MKNTLAILFILLASIVNAADTTKVTVQVGSGSKFSAINVIDKVTGNYVTATITNVSVQNLNPELATVSPNDPNPIVIKVSPIKAGSGTAIVSCQVDYVDPGDGLQKSETKSIVISYTVIAAAHGVRLSLSF